MANTEKEQLLELIERIPETKLLAAVQLLQTLDEQPDAAAIPQAPDATHQLLLALVSTFTNTLYDLSSEAEKRCAKAAAKRMDLARRQIIQAWESYNKDRTV
ncbi:MAG TPA: hypothetical protein VN611_01060 [Patescibacteria group bacterium]|nr:hypothetical protein [Patescibacteria group bacterium]